MSLTTRERGTYTRGAYIRVEKRVTNLGGLYSGELIHGGGLIYGILRYKNRMTKIRCFQRNFEFIKKNVIYNEKFQFVKKNLKLPQK